MIMPNPPRPVGILPAWMRFVAPFLLTVLTIEMIWRAFSGSEPITAGRWAVMGIFLLFSLLTWYSAIWPETTRMPPSAPSPTSGRRANSSD